jgi:parallel beta-helix repeat protein
MKISGQAIKALWVAVALAASLRCSSAATFYQGVTPATVPWPGGVVPYQFDPGITPQQEAVYLDGMREWELAANIQFVPHTTESHYVILRFFYQQGTNTYVASDPPVLTIDSLSRAQICHETGHLLGFQHEHVRTNRDDYITVNFNNLQTGVNGEGPGSGGISNLYVIDTNSTSFGAYDFESVMHYGRRLFAADPNVDVIAPLPPYVAHYYNRIGNFCISPLDRAGAAYLYGAPATPITNIVTTTADVGLGSLRAAIYYANDNPGTTISFNIPTTDPGFSNGVYTIYLTGELPPLVANGTVIDGTTQPGFVGKPIVAIDGSQLLPETGGASGIQFFESNCTLRGLAIGNVTFSAIEMLYNFCASNHVKGCFLGLAPDGTNAAPNGFEGVNIAGGAHGNVIGGETVSQRNVISGNVHSYGVTITETNSDGNVVLGNFLGLDASGALTVSNGYSGVGIWGGARNTVVGGATAGAGNVISGNGQYGIFIGDPGTTGTVVQGNLIGTDATGNQAKPNMFGGIAVFNGANNVVIGGTNARNVISGNGTVGIYLLGSGASNNVVQGNYVGLNAAGTAAVPNSFAGIYLLGGAQNNLIGGTNAGEGNIVSGNASEGIYIADPGTGNNLVIGNRIGTDASGANAVPNGFTGVIILNGAQNNFVGGTNVGAGNLISGNGGSGIVLDETNTSGNVVQGNLIGVNLSATGPLPNRQSGVAILGGASGNAIGAPNPAARNILSGNAGDGVYIDGSSTNSIQGNFIGTDIGGVTAISNLDEGVVILSAAGNQIGGPTAGAGNVIVASSYQGIFITGAGATGNRVQGNNIGVGADGLTSLGNGFQGIVMIDGAASNLVGGTSTAARNILSGNGTRGVWMSGSGTVGNLVQGNYIGVAADGTTAVSNLFEGVVILDGAQGNIIGFDVSGAGAANLISNSKLEGVAVYDSGSTGNTIRGNSIFNNRRLGINLGGGTEDSFGVTANDFQDTDTGPNNLQNFPVITSASVSGGAMTVAGTLNSTPNRTFQIDVYGNSAADPSGHGEGQVYLGRVPLSTDAGGNGNFSFNASGNFLGQYIATTATDTTTGDTSEFSASVIASNGPPPSITIVGPFALTNGVFGFNVQLQTNLPYRIQATTNLAGSNSWVDLTNFTATSSPVSFADPGASNFVRRFYRIVSP